MKNITIKGHERTIDLDRQVRLNNGSLVLLKNDERVEKVYMVVSFRDNKNRYYGSDTSAFCTLLNLDNGKYEFEERCSRYTTVKRVLKHLLHIKDNIPYDLYGGYDIEIYTLEKYHIDINFFN